MPIVALSLMPSVTLHVTVIPENETVALPVADSSVTPLVILKPLDADACPADHPMTQTAPTKAASALNDLDFVIAFNRPSN